MIGISRVSGEGRGKRRSAKRFARRGPYTELVVFALIMAVLGAAILSGANHDAFHKVLVTKPLKRAITN
jgi:hypothetical protein